MAKVGINDKVWQRIRRNASALNGKVVKVGVVGDGANAAADDEGSITVGRLAGVHEFGAAIQTRNGVILIPERSFIRATIGEKRATLSALIGRLAGKVLDGKLSLDTALGLLGAKAAGEMQRRISAGIEPPNAPSTAAAKGSETPLIDTGRLRASVSFAVVDSQDVK